MRIVQYNVSGDEDKLLIDIVKQYAKNGDPDVIKSETFKSLYNKITEDGTISNINLEDIMFGKSL